MREELLKLSHWHMKSAGHGTLTDINLLLRAGECVSVSGSENSGRKLLAEMFDGKGVPVKKEETIAVIRRGVGLRAENHRFSPAKTGTQRRILSGK